jgi:hypothetical protein
MPIAHRLLPLVCLGLLSACSPTTPLFIAQVATHEVVEYKTLKNNRMLAAIEEEGDLLTYSAQAIRDGKSEKAEQLYLTGYRDEKLSNEVRAISLYQSGLLYMNRFNEQRDDGKALNYFYQVLNEFPASRAAERAEARIVMIRQRANEPVHKTSRELLAFRQQLARQSQPVPGTGTFDPAVQSPVLIVAATDVDFDRWLPIQATEAECLAPIAVN